MNIFVASGTSPNIPWGSLITGAAIFISAVVALFAFLQSQKANRATASASRTAVDAAAYERAKSLYEGVIEAITEERSSLRAEVTGLRTEVISLRRSNEKLAEEIAELQTAKHDLSQQVTRLRREITRLGGTIKDE